MPDISEKNKIGVSIIIPAYNVEGYIGDTMKMIAKQTYGDFEAIIVNDGSTDGTGDVVRKFCESDTRFRMIEKENGGVSSARNAGIEDAKGEYMVFWDADDEIPEKSLEYLHSAMEREEADMVIGIRALDTMTELSRPETLKELTKQREISKVDSRLVWCLTAANKMYRTSILHNNSVRFRSNILCEDGIFWFEYMKYCRKITGCPHDVYVYKKRNFTDSEKSLSLSTSIHTEHFRGMEYVRYFENACEALFDGMEKSIENRYYREKLFQELYKKLMREQVIGDVYRFIWSLDDDGEKSLHAAFNIVKNKLYKNEWDSVLAKESDIDIRDGLKTKKELREKPLITLVVTADAKDPELILKSIYGQNFPEFEVLIDGRIAEAFGGTISGYENIRVTRGSTRAEIKNAALDDARGKWIMFFEEDMFFGINTLKGFVRKASKSDKMVSLYVKTVSGRKLKDIKSLEKTFASQDKRLRKEIDRMFSNKVFLVDWLRSEKFKFTDDSASDIARLFDMNKSSRKKSVVMMTYLSEDDYMSGKIHWKTKLKLKYLR